MGATYSNTVASTFTKISSYTATSGLTTVTIGTGGTIPQTYTDLQLVMSLQSSGGTVNSFITLNGNSGSSDYGWIRMYGVFNGGKGVGIATATNQIILGDVTASAWTTDVVYIPEYTNTTYKKSVLIRSGVTGSAIHEIVGTYIPGNPAITSISVTMNGTAFAAGSTFDLYGILKG